MNIRDYKVRHGRCCKEGFTTVCAMPNTNPVNDNSSVTEFIIRKAVQEGSCSVYPIGAITKLQRVKSLQR